MEDGKEKRILKTYQKITELEVDRLKINLGRKDLSLRTKEILKEEVENHPQVKFERLKEWLKKNGIEVSAFVLSIGSFIAAMVTVLRKTVQTAAKGAFSFGKAVVKVLSKLGPVFSALGSVIMSLLGIASKALMWLGNNLWILLVFLVMFLWKVGEKYFKKK